MPVRTMHANEFVTDAALVRRLLAAQFPDLAHLDIVSEPSSGTDNTMYRVGDELAVRLPRIERVVAQARKQRQWLPQLAPHLPVAVPVPLAAGLPGEGYPWPWSVCPWLPGENPSVLGDADAFAIELAEFVVALHAVDPSGGPVPGAHNFFRGVPLAARDAQTRAAIDAARSMIDADAVLAAWNADLHAPESSIAPVWIHGDLSPGNVLCEDGRLSAVIDFGGLAVGDLACDCIVAWNLLPAAARSTYRAALDVDDAAWARGRGWALSIALLQLPYYRTTHPALAANSRHVIDQVLRDHDTRG